ncbi:MAG: aminopeptidase P family protein [Cyanobacteria bacterium J06635_15]
MQSLVTPTHAHALAATLKNRRDRLSQRIDFPVVLWSGQPHPRNFPANVYPFRANSHFLYFAGLPLVNAAIHLAKGKLTLFIDEATPAEALWHGPTPSRQDLAETMGADNALPLGDLSRYLGEAVTLAGQNSIRGVASANQAEPDHQRTLAEAMIQLRLSHDTSAIAAIRQAATVSVAAHKAGLAATANALTEAQVRAAMEQVILAANMTCAYNSIVTVCGEVLHNEHYHHTLHPGDLLLADVGAEAPSGWASDITRTWPITGQFSATQRAIYDVVLAAHDACIAHANPGVEYRGLHLLACRVLTEGLVDIGILKGSPDSLVEQDAHALFFPHGVGHLLGLDVHDMEDLGDLAGYAPGRTRSDRFGLAYLRLDRPLQMGMVVTIEPGFYQVPGILQNAQTQATYQSMVNWERLTQFDDVRGIRIEDDVLITASSCEVITADLPTQASEIETLVIHSA